MLWRNEPGLPFWIVKALLLLIASIAASFSNTSSVDAHENESPRDSRPSPTTSESRKTWTPTETLQFSEQIDRLIEKHLATSDQTIGDLSRDETFLRRTYLKTIGRIPNIDETNQFLRSDSKNKRSQLIDELLDSYGYVSHQFNYFADLLRIKTRVRNVPGQPYIDFVKDALESNMPWDDFVWQLLAAEGALFEKGNGAVGYYLRDVNMPEDNMSNTIRVFLGTRLECAQCHDHPFDKWTQRQYFEMVAFTGGLQYQVDRENFANEMRQLRRSGDIDGQAAAAANRALRILRGGVEGSGTGLARLPENYEGSDGDANEVITAKTMFEGEALVDAEVPATNGRKKKKKRKQKGGKRHMVPGAREVNSREAYATWLTEIDNPRFAKVIANRLWKEAFGIGLIEPVDVIEDSTVASNPELLDYLAQIMIEVQFDLKQFNRIIFNTRAWQAEVATGDVAEPHKYGFASPVMQRMSAEQIWDSLVGLTVDKVDVRSSNPVQVPGQGKVDGYAFYEQFKDLSAKEFYDRLLKGKGKASKRGKGSQDGVETRKKNQKMLSDDAQKNSRKQRKKFERKIKDLNKEILKARSAGDDQKARELMIARADMVSQQRAGTSNGQFRRASELPSPAPTKHFLREFGQSDRDTIENANTDPAVTQVLRLMNGFVDQTIGKDPNTVLIRNVLEADDEKGAVEAVFLTMLSRRPAADELKLWRRDFQKDPRTACTDLIWTLINSNEFIFIK